MDGIVIGDNDTGGAALQTGYSVNIAIVALGTYGIGSFMAAGGKEA